MRSAFRGYAGYARALPRAWFSARALPRAWFSARALPLAFYCAAWMVLAPPGELKAFEPATPHLDAFLAGLDQREPRPVPPGLRAFAGDSTALRLNAADVIDMFTAAEQDTLTLLRVNVVLARWIAERNLPLYADGEAVDEALKQGFSLGLTFPLNHISYLFFSPDAARSGDFLVHIRALYDMNYTFRFDRDILDADVIVHGAETAYTDDGGPRTSYLVKLELHDELEWARYTDFEGLSGRKRGVAGFFQRVFFFIPKTLDGLELRDGHLKIKAFIDQHIEDFERLERYHVKR